MPSMRKANSAVKNRLVSRAGPKIPSRANNGTPRARANAATSRAPASDRRPACSTGEMPALATLIATCPTARQMHIAVIRPIAKASRRWWTAGAAVVGELVVMRGAASFFGLPVIVGAAR